MRHDYFVTGKSIASHDAIKLPAANNIYALSAGLPTGAWIQVGSGITVTIGHSIGDYVFGSYGTWYTCNYNCTKPEQLGSLYTFDAANALGVTLPTKNQFEKFSTSGNCSYTWLTVHGQQGTVVRPNSGFLFLPAQNETLGCYWSSTESGENLAWLFYFYSGGGHMDDHNRTIQFAVRPIQN